MLVAISQNEVALPVFGASEFSGSQREGPQNYRLSSLQEGLARTHHVAVARDHSRDLAKAGAEQAFGTH